MSLTKEVKKKNQANVFSNISILLQINIPKAFHVNLAISVSYVLLPGMTTWRRVKVSCDATTTTKERVS